METVMVFEKFLNLLTFLTEQHAMQVYWRVEVRLHSFFDLGTGWRRVVSFTPLPLYPQGKSIWYPLLGD
jgi:hypothetical protein